MPLELYQIWVQYPWTLGDLACDAKIVIMEAIIYASILTIVAFSFERWTLASDLVTDLWLVMQSWHDSYGYSEYIYFRYMAICKPLSPMARSTMGEARKIILLIWIISFISALPWAMFTKVSQQLLLTLLQLSSIINTQSSLWHIGVKNRGSKKKFFLSFFLTFTNFNFYQFTISSRNIKLLETLIPTHSLSQSYVRKYECKNATENFFHIWPQGSFVFCHKNSCPEKRSRGKMN